MHFSTVVYLTAFITMVWCSACKEGDYSCNDGKCIPQEYVCDGHYDCTDGKDETSCKEIVRSAIDFEPIEADAPTFPLEFGEAKPVEEIPASRSTNIPTVIEELEPIPAAHSTDMPTLIEEIPPATSGASRSF